MISRRNLLLSSISGLVATALARLKNSYAQVSTLGIKESGINEKDLSENYVPVKTLNGRTLNYRLKNGVKEFHLIAEEIEHEFAPGTKIKAWGYNGSTPGPTSEAVEGDRVRILVTNKLPEATSIHWHGILLPNGMDGVAGLTQPAIEPGETYVYEFTLKQSGTQM